MVKKWGGEKRRRLRGSATYTMGKRERWGLGGGRERKGDNKARVIGRKRNCSRQKTKKSRRRSRSHDHGTILLCFGSPVARQPGYLNAGGKSGTPGPCQPTPESQEGSGISSGRNRSGGFILCAKKPKKKGFLSCPKRERAPKRARSQFDTRRG